MLASPVQSTIPVTLIFSDGVSRRLLVPRGGPLMATARDAGMNLLTDCANGQCGTCTAQLVSGEVELDDYDPSVLSDDDRAGGSVLPCVCRVDVPCVLEFPYDSSEALSEQPPPLTASISHIAQVAEDAVRLELQVPEKVHFEPGQYVRIHVLGSDITRSYSMANVPGTDRLEFFIRLVPGGGFSTWLQGAGTGDSVEISAPHGSFFLRGEDRPRLFVAGGTGVAPFLSMLRALAEAPLPARQPTTLVIGARTPGHLIAMQELDQLKAKLPQLSVHVTVEQGDSPAAHHGFPTDLIGRIPIDAGTRVYLCGPPPMVEAGRRAAETAGLSRQDVLCERFT